MSRSEKLPHLCALADAKNSFNRPAEIDEKDKVGFITDWL